MNVNGPGAGGIDPNSIHLSQPAAKPPAELTNVAQEGDERIDPKVTREKFNEFVGQTLFGSMLASMRKSQSAPAYMHGGRTEEVFQQQLDQEIVGELSKATVSTISDPMFDLFMARRTP